MSKIERAEERHVVSVPLYVSPHAKRVLEARFNVAHHIYNDFLGECERRRKKHMNLPSYKLANDLWKRAKDEKDKEEKKRLTIEYKNEYLKSEIESGFYIQSSSKNGKNNSLEQYAGHITGTWMNKHIDSGTRNKLMERAFAASKLSIYGQKKLNKKTGFWQRPKVKFKKFGRDFITSLEGKNYKSALRYVDKTIVWSGLILPFLKKTESDIKLKNIFANPKIITYVRLKRKMVNKDWLYFADLVCEGKPVVKPDTVYGKGTVGVDVGPSTIAYVSDSKAGLQFITSLDYKKLAKEQKKLQRKIDRQRRANNPHNYNEDNTVKAGAKKWHVSKRQRLIEKQLAEIQRKISEARKCEHRKFVNDMRSQGDVLNLDKDSYKVWQQSGFGVSIGRHAPGQLISLAEEKFNLTNGKVNHINTFTSKSSQTCPNCGHQEKKGNGKNSLSVRIHTCSKCNWEQQRDITSAIVNKFVKSDHTLNVDESKQFIEDKKPILQACIEGIIKSAREGQFLSSTFGKLSELERIACVGNESD